MMSETMRSTDGNDANTTTEYEPEYGDTFEHIITHEEHTIQSAYDGKVTWVEGGWDPIEEVVNAVDDDASSMYRPVAIGADVYEGEGY